MNERYLITKMPYVIYYQFPCGNPDDCSCVNMPVYMNDDFPLMLLPYNPDAEGASIEYEKMKEKGLILHETDDIETAQIILKDAAEQYSTDKESSNS